MAHAARRLRPAGGAVLGVIGSSYSASVAGFIAVRFALGIGESGNFPAAIKTVAEWFPQARARASRPASSTPAPTSARSSRRSSCRAITLRYGWHRAFIATGAIGFLWLALWWPLYERPEHHPRVGAAELRATSAAIRRNRPCDAWRTLLPHRQTWAFAIGEVHDRSDLVGLPVLDSGLPQPQARHRPAVDGAAARRRSTWSRTSAASAAAGCRRR